MVSVGLSFFRHMRVFMRSQGALVSLLISLVVTCCVACEAADGGGSGGSQSTSGGGSQCLALDRVSSAERPPAGVRVVFRVTDCDGNPVRALSASDVTIINDEKGEPFGTGGEGGGVSAPTTPSQYGLYSILVLDMSDSIFNAGAVNDVVDGARVFVQEMVERPAQDLKHEVAVMVFGRSNATRIVQPFTSDTGALYAALEALRSAESLGTTNLYGAYLDAIAAVTSAGQGLELAERSVVILTDGTHEAGNEESLREQALAARDEGSQSGSLSVFSVGIRGEYDEGKLRELATRPTHFRLVDDAGELEGVFGEFAGRLDAIARSNYAVGVCTPVELGNPSLTIQVSVDERSASVQVPYSTASLTGETSSCDPQVIAAE